MRWFGGLEICISSDGDMISMSIRDFPAERSTDAEIFAALLGLVPTRSEARIKLRSRGETMDLAEEMRQAGDDKAAFALTSELMFDPDATFNDVFSRVSSKSLRIRTSTLFRLLLESREKNEGRGEMLLRTLLPSIKEAILRNMDEMDPEKIKLIISTLEDMAVIKRHRPPEEVTLDDPHAFQRGPPLPVIHHRSEGDRFPEDIRKYSRYFLKNLFRLNNIHDNDEFFHPPEVIEKFWEVIAPDQGMFSISISPVTNEMHLTLFKMVRSFGLARSDNPDYLKLAEFLTLEARRSSIKGCRVELRGMSRSDDAALQEMMGIEALIIDDHECAGISGKIAGELTPEGLDAFRKRLKELSGIMVRFHFPVEERDQVPDLENENGGQYSSLHFEIALEDGRFFVDGVDLADDGDEQLMLLLGGKLLDLSRRLYHVPDRFPTPEIDELDAEVHRLMEKAEKEGLTEELARNIIAKITILDYYESLAKFSMAVSEELKRYLESTVVVTFTIPRVLMAFLDEALEERKIDDIVNSELEREGP